VLIICDNVPGHRASGEVRLARLAALLAEQDTVALLAVDRDLDDFDGARVEHLRATGVDVLDARGSTALRAVLTERLYDLVIIEFWHVAERYLGLVWARQPHAVVAVDSVDLHFLREERGAACGGTLPAGRQDRKRRELAVYEAADVRIFTSQVELDLYSAATGIVEDNVIVSNIVDPRHRVVRRRQPYVVFVGNFWHAPNLDGARWFAERVWPIVRSARKDAIFAIAGSRMGPEVHRLAEIEGLEVLGFVDDIHALYEKASVAVAPLRFGAGVKGKVTEALAAGMPMVASSVAAEGLGLSDGVDLLIADDASTFAAKLIGLLNDPRAGELLGSNGRDTIQRRCGPEPARAALRSLFERANRVGAWRRARLRVRVRARVRSLPDRAWLWLRPTAAAAFRAARLRLTGSAP
jgi:glycosyltransferase involved in cell wall biosynthesis